MIYHLLHETNTGIIQLEYISFSEKYRYADESIEECYVWDSWIKKRQNLNLTSIYEIKSIN